MRLHAVAAVWSSLSLSRSLSQNSNDRLATVATAAGVDQLFVYVFVEWLFKFLFHPFSKSVVAC